MDGPKGGDEPTTRGAGAEAGVARQGVAGEEAAEERAWRAGAGAGVARQGVAGEVAAAERAMGARAGAGRQGVTGEAERAAGAGADAGRQGATGEAAGAGAGAGRQEVTGEAEARAWAAGAAGGLPEHWRREAIAGAARPFGLACAALPVLDICEQHSVIAHIAAALHTGTWPAVPAAAWLWIAYFAALAAAAAVILARRAARGRWRLFFACAALHAGYALASGLRFAALVSLGLFAWSFVALRTADLLDPRAPRGGGYLA